METLTPPITPKLNGDANSQPSKKFIEDPEHVPADVNIPDNYVSYTLKHQKSLPPITWDNWYKELNWLHVAILAGTPVVGLVGAYYTRLRWETAIWSVVYYYMTGLGKLWCHLLNTLSDHHFRYHCWLPPAVGTPFLQRVKTPSVCSRIRRCGCSRRLYQMVVTRTPRSPSLHRH
jgi:hypothetical protein